MADTDAQTPEIGGGETRLNVAQAVVTRVATSLFHLYATGRQVEFVMHHEDLIGQNFVERGQRLHRLAGTVHEG